jgi:hypothetical protein
LSASRFRRDTLWFPHFQLADLYGILFDEVNVGVPRALDHRMVGEFDGTEKQRRDRFPVGKATRVRCILNANTCR